MKYINSRLYDFTAARCMSNRFDEVVIGSGALITSTARQELADGARAALDSGVTGEWDMGTFVVQDPARLWEACS